MTPGPDPDRDDGALQGVLSGVRVLDFSAMMAGPNCARWLSAMGADVIKVESPKGDHMRTPAPIRDGHNIFFGHLNSGKRFVALDLKRPEAVALAIELVKTADVLVEAFRPGVMHRLGLGPMELRPINPRLVYFSISGFGQNSSASDRSAYARVVHAASGYYLAHFDYQDEADRPVNSGIPMADILTAIFTALSIHSALLQRERTGRGAVIDVTLMDAMMSVMPYELQAAQFSAPNRRPLYKQLRASDGFVLVAPVNTRNFLNLCSATGHPQWASDPMRGTNRARLDHRDEYMLRIEEWTSQRSSAECESVLMADGVPCSRYRRTDEVIRDPEFAERDSFAPISDGAGEYLTSNLPFSLDGRKPAAHGTVGAVGRDSVDVLQSLPGIDVHTIGRLVHDGIIVA